MGQTPHQQRHAQRNIETEKGKKKEMLSRYGKDGIIFVILTFWNGASQVVLVVKNSPANAGDIRDMGSIPRLGRSPGGGKVGGWGPKPHSCSSEGDRDLSLPSGFSLTSSSGITRGMEDASCSPGGI